MATGMNWQAAAQHVRADWPEVVNVWTATDGLDVELADLSRVVITAVRTHWDRSQVRYLLAFYENGSRECSESQTFGDPRDALEYGRICAATRPAPIPTPWQIVAHLLASAPRATITRRYHDYHEAAVDVTKPGYAHAWRVEVAEDRTLADGRMTCVVRVWKPLDAPSADLARTLVRHFPNQAHAVDFAERIVDAIARGHAVEVLV